MKSKEAIGQLDDQLLRINDVAKLTTLSKSSINLWIAQGRFPRPITLSKTVKVWTLKSVRAWAIQMEQMNEGKHA
jgi:prophage regulatory protein